MFQANKYGARTHLSFTTVTEQSDSLVGSPLHQTCICIAICDLALSIMTSPWALVLPFCKLQWDTGFNATDPLKLHYFLHISTSHPNESAEHFEPLLSQRASTGSVAETLSAQNTLWEADPLSCWTIDSVSIVIKVAVHCSQATLTSREKVFQLYCKLYSVSDHSNVVMSSMYIYCFVNGKLLGS